MYGRWLAATAVVLLLGATSCSDDDDDTAESSSTSSTTTPTTVSPEAEVKTAYLAFWDMFVRLAQAPDPSDPEIAQRSSGETLRKVVDGLTALRDSNQRSEFGPHYQHQVLSVDVEGGDTAVLRDCAVDDSRRVDASSGDIVEEAVVTELSEVTLIRGTTGWLVDHSTRLNAWEGAVVCS
jgi:hypothetical protein